MECLGRMAQLGCRENREMMGKKAQQGCRENKGTQAYLVSQEHRGHQDLRVKEDCLVRLAQQGNGVHKEEWGSQEAQES